MPVVLFYCCRRLIANAQQSINAIKRFGKQWQGYLQSVEGASGDIILAWSTSLLHVQVTFKIFSVYSTVS